MTGARLDEADRALVSAQIGREPRSPWRVVVRCRFGRPQAIASPPMLDDGTPFPTLYWLSCPYLLRWIRQAESSGTIAATASHIAEDETLAASVLAADAEYRRRRAAEGGGEDPCADVGLAGQRDPLATKCLHAHVAARLAGIEDPIGGRILRESGTSCVNDECASLVPGDEEAT